MYGWHTILALSGAMNWLQIMNWSAPVLHPTLWTSFTLHQLCRSHHKGVLSLITVHNQIFWFDFDAINLYPLLSALLKYTTPYTHPISAWVHDLISIKYLIKVWFIWMSGHHAEVHLRSFNITSLDTNYTGWPDIGLTSTPSYGLSSIARIQIQRLHENDYSMITRIHRRT